jgi:hypothetical protein
MRHRKKKRFMPTCLGQVRFYVHNLYVLNSEFKSRPQNLDKFWI